MGLSDGRAQAHTLEAVVAALLLLSGLTFALQTTAVTPLSASTASQHIENQQQAQADGLLASAAQSGALRRAVLFWNDTAAGFYGTDERGYYSRGGPPNEFGRMLNQTFGDRGRAFNVYLSYVTEGGTLRHDRQVAMVYMGEPTDNSVSATWTVTLYDDDRLFKPAAGTSYATQPTAVTLNGTTTYPVPERSGVEGVYRVIRVEVVVWRM